MVRPELTDFKKLHYLFSCDDSQAKRLFDSLFMGELVASHCRVS